MMKGNTTSRRPKLRFNHCFLAALSIFLFHSALFFYRYTRIGIDRTEQDITNHSKNDFCDSINTSPMDGGVIGESVFRQWNYIDETIEREFPKSKVSGGIFLYPRQASILTHLTKIIHAGLGDGDHSKTITICETGYGSGHSMALFQEASISIGPIRLISFDKFDRPYQLPIWHHFNESSSISAGDDHNRTKTFDYVKGNSCETVPKHLQLIQCDVLHGSSLCPTDNIDLVENSPCGVLLTSTAMNSVNDRAVYFGPNAQWRKLRKRNCISNIVCFQEDDTHTLALKRDFIFAKQGSKRTGKFCVAVTTGRCRRDKPDSIAMSEKCTADLKQLLSQLNLNKMCPQYQIETPV